MSVLRAGTDELGVLRTLESRLLFMSCISAPVLALRVVGNMTPQCMGESAPHPMTGASRAMQGASFCDPSASSHTSTSAMKMFPP
jgi:hypothetical protein